MLLLVFLVAAGAIKLVTAAAAEQLLLRCVESAACLKHHNGCERCLVLCRIKTHTVSGVVPFSVKETTKVLHSLCIKACTISIGCNV